MKENIKTNYSKDRYEYPVCNGSFRSGWIMKLKISQRESNEEFFNRLVEAGYTNIKLYEVTTRVRGCHDTIAYVK